MKTCLGLFILALTISVHSRTRNSQSKTGTLLLRGRVPASTSIEWDKTDKNSIPKYHSNRPGITPRIEVSNKKDHRKITIIHP